MAAYVLIDDFEDYTTGNSSTSTAFVANSGPWQPRDISGDLASTSLVGIANATGVGKYLYFAENNGGARSAYRAVTPIVQGARGIYYFQIYTTDITPYQSYGLSDQATATVAGFGDFEAYVTLVDADGAVPGFNLVGRNGGSDATVASGLVINTWYDVWLDVNNATDTYDVYFGTTGDPDVLGTKVGTGLGFQNGTASNDLATFMTLDDAAAISARGSARLDNIYYAAVPEPSTFVLAALGLLGLTGIRRRSRNRWGRKGDRAARLGKTPMNDECRTPVATLPNRP